MATSYDVMFQLLIKEATEYSDKMFAHSVDNNMNIIIDKTNMSKKSRQKYINGLSNHYKVVAIDFKLDEEIRSFRMEHRGKNSGKNIPAHVIESMQKSYVAPSLDEFDVIINVVNDNIL